MKKKFLFAGLMLAALWLFGSLAAGQEVTTGTITGVVHDEQGQPLPGATVSVTSAQGMKTETSDNNGAFRFPFLTPGMYDIVAEMEGMRKVERKNVDLRLGATVHAEMVLVPGAAEAIEVIGETPIVNLVSTTTGASIGAELIQSVPVGRSFSSTLSLAPSVVDSGVDSSNPSIGGASGLENTYMIDGVNIGNTGYGSAGSYSILYGSLGTGVNFDYIQEVQVKTGGYEPEFGEALGGFINIITKSGGNSPKGSLFTYFRPGILEGGRKELTMTNALVDVTKYDSVDFGGEVGGPIMQNKLFYFGAFNPHYTDTDIRTARATRESQGIDFMMDQERNLYNYAGNVKWFINPKHTLMASAFGDPSKGPNGPQRESALDIADPEIRFSEISYGGNNVTGRWVGELMNNFYVEGSIGYHRDKFDETLAYNYPSGTDRRPPTWVRFGGVGFFSDDLSQNTQYRAKASNFFRAKGEHNLRYGFEFENIRYNEIASYSGSPGLVLPNGQTSTTGYTYYIAHDPIAGDFLSISRIRSSDPAQKTQAHYLGFYAYDSWNITKFINVMAGLRYESDKLVGTGNSFTWDKNWAPRFHVTWDPTKDNKSKVSLAYGRFFGKVPNDLAVRALGREVSYTIRYHLSDVDLSNPLQPRFTGDPYYFTQLGTLPTEIDPNSKLTYQDEWIAGAEREVMPFLNVGASFLYRKLGRTLEDVMLVGYSEAWNNPDALAAAPYFITNPSPAVGSPNPSRKYLAFTLKADRRFHDNWQFLGSYTWSRLKGNYEGYYRRDNGQSDPFITSGFDFQYLRDPDIWRYTIADGVLPNDRTHVFNLYGSYMTKYKLNVGIGARIQTGMPLTKLGWNLVYDNGEEIVLEPRGASGRGATTSVFDLHLDYPLKVFGTQDFQLILDVFNIFNQVDGVDYYMSYESGGTVNPSPSLLNPDPNNPGPLPPCPECVDPDFGKVASYASPRSFRVAVRWAF